MTERAHLRGDADAPKDEAPRLSVVFLSYNRRDMLRDGLASVVNQDHDSVQIVVVDNASEDGSADMVRAEFPQVELVALTENCGIRGRNVGFREARAPVVLSLDDDIRLLRPGALARVLEHFATHPACVATTLKITEDGEGREYADAHWWHPRSRDGFQDQSFETDQISEAAVAFRRDALERAGGYYESLFWGGEQWDLALALIDGGGEIHYLPEPVHHGAPRGDLNHLADPRHALNVRNRCWIALRRLPVPQALAYTVPRLALWALRSLRYGYAKHYLEGLVGLVRALPQIWRERKVVSRQTLTRLRAIRSGV
ncbi:MAG: glycosyltransferase [Myxococcota bacterium]